MGTKNLARLCVGVCKTEKLAEMGGSHLLAVYITYNFHI